MRVAAENPEVSDAERKTFVEPDPATWRFLELRLPKNQSSNAGNAASLRNSSRPRLSVTIDLLPRFEPFTISLANGGLAFGGRMEKADILNPNIDWAHLVRHVAADQVSVELSEGSHVIAEVIPKRTPILMKNFADFMNSIPRLGDETDSFAMDIESSRKIFLEASDPWES